MTFYNATLCRNNQPTSVNFGGYVPSIGEVWNVMALDDQVPYCVTITTGITDAGSSLLLDTQYTDCYDCMSNNYGVVSVTDCIRGDEYILTLDSFGFIPIEGATYYLTFILRGSITTTCVTVNTRGGAEQIDSETYNNSILYQKFGIVQTTPTLEGSCQECLTNNSLPYIVQRCTDGTPDVVLLINDSFINHIISYSDGINEYCGVVAELGSEGTPFTFINDYGLTDDGATCDECLATENQKVLLQSCTDSEYTEVVWASSLFQGGDISNLSTDSGCFEVIGSTEDDVTINNYLNFDPQPGCEPCIECNGINYKYTTCSSGYDGDFKSYQYLPNGTYFYNPALGECCKVGGTSSSYYDTLYSVETFGTDDCTDCQTNADVVIWNASACTNSNTYSSFYVTTDSTATTGDVVKLMWGSNEWICAGLINTVSSYSGYYTYYNTQKNGSDETLVYDTCESCNSQGLIGVTLVSCEGGVESFVSITLDNYLSIYNFGSLTNYSVTGENGQCYQITNICPIPLTAEGFTPVEFNFNCFFCESFIPPRSANTETHICIPDCDFTGSTAVTPPHPVWTDGYGIAVTQLNMVTIGGNGLNG